jgi:hypothetical protein
VALKELVQQVKDELRFASTVLKQEIEIKRAISLEYQALADERAWSWLYKTTTMWAVPDLTIANGGLTRVNDRSFTVSQATIRAAVGTADALFGVDEFDFHRMMLTGAEFDLADTSLRSSGNGVWGRAPFEVENVKNSVGTTEQFWLDPRCRITSITGNEGSFIFRWPRYRLPSDCARLERIHHFDDRAPLTALTEERGAELRPGTASRPTHFWMDTAGLQPRRVPMDFPELGLDETDNAAQNDDNFGRRNRAPNDELWSVSSTAGSAVTTFFKNGTYEIGIAWWYANRWSPMSVRSLTIDWADGYGNILPTVLPPMLTAGVASANYGRRLGVFASRNGGPFYLITQGGAADFVGGSSITQNPLALDNPGTWRRYDEMYPPEGYQYVRLWPRPTALTRFEAKYLGRPRNLLGDTDVPELPTNHDVIVFRAALRLMNRNDQPEAFRRTSKLAEDAYTRMCRRYGVEPHLRSTRGMIDQAAGLSSWPSPNINYNGDT